MSPPWRQVRAGQAFLPHTPGPGLVGVALRLERRTETERVLQPREHVEQAGRTLRAQAGAGFGLQSWLLGLLPTTAKRNSSLQAGKGARPPPEQWNQTDV